MATVVVAQPSSVITVSDWQQQTNVSFNSTTTLAELEKENSKEEVQIEEKAKPPKVEPILEWQRKEFERLVEELGCSIYPTRDEKEKLAILLKATYAQITRLFANHRRRVLKKKATTTRLSEEDNSVEKFLTMVKEPSPATDKLIHDDTSTSERSISPVIRYDSSSETDDSLVAICGAVADQIHDDIENKQKQNVDKKKRTRTNKRKACERDAQLEATVDEILSKVSREEVDVEFEKKGEITSKDKSDKNMSSTMVGISATPNVNEQINTSFLSYFNELMAKPPMPLPEKIMADVNPKLLEAMDLLNKGVSWTHPSILSVVVEIMSQQKTREQQLLAQIQQRQTHLNLPETLPPPAPESVSSKSSERSMEEMMRSLTPDEYLAVNVLTEMANFC